MSCYLHRINNEKQASYCLSNKGILTIGFLFDTEEEANTALEKSREDVKVSWGDFKDYIAKLWGEAWRTKRAKDSLWYFAQINSGDYIVVPKDYGMFSIYKAKDCAKPIMELPNDKIPETDFSGKKKLFKKDDGYLYIEGNPEPLDLGYYIECELIKADIKRSAAGAELCSAMKYRSTTKKLSEELLDEVIDLSRNENANTLVSKIDREKQKKIESIEKFIRHVLNPDQFEELVCDFFYKLGASDSVIQSKRQKKIDGNEYSDSDVRAEFDKFKLVINIQVKHHSGKTDAHAVKQIKDFADQSRMHDFEQKDGWTYSAWVITSADDFDNNAKDEAKKNNIRLIALKEFSEMLSDVNLI